MTSRKALPPDELEAALRTLPAWRLVTTDGRVELTRSYEFPSFPAAIRFMAAAVEPIEALNHHPRWENAWRTVTVWLCTWDAGHRPSALDLELARTLDALFAATG
jgi:4a-hydroxytetrahydrobiopterin dehydratase